MKIIPLLLADPSYSLRLLILKELLGRDSSDSEVQELELALMKDPLITDLLKFQQSTGSWKSAALLDSSHHDEILLTSMVLLRLSFMGLDKNHPQIERGIEYLFSQQQSDGSWPIPGGKPRSVDGGYSIIPLQTALPLRAIAACGQATDDRSELAFEWLIENRLKDGAWPVGIKAGRPGYIAGYRKLPHSKNGCRTNTTAALTCLAYHPKRKNGMEAKRALDLLLGRETKERNTLGFEVARLVGIEPFRGYLTFHALFDPAFILNLCWRIGANSSDERVQDFITFIVANQGHYGLWEYIPAPQASRWITFDLLRSLSNLDRNENWINFEPRTPFQPYPKKPKRF